MPSQIHIGFPKGVEIGRMDHTTVPSVQEYHQAFTDVDEQSYFVPGSVLEISFDDLHKWWKRSAYSFKC